MLSSLDSSKKAKRTYRPLHHSVTQGLSLRQEAHLHLKGIGVEGARAELISIEATEGQLKAALRLIRLARNARSSGTRASVLYASKRAILQEIALWANQGMDPAGEEDLEAQIRVLENPQQQHTALKGKKKAM